MAKRGRPKWTPPSIEQVEALAAQGLTLEQIAAALGIHYDTLNERKKELSDFSEALKRGRAKGTAKIANALFQSAVSGNTTAQIFWLKAMAGWKERFINEHTGLDGKPIEHRGFVAVIPTEAGSVDEWIENHLETTSRSTD